MKNYRDVKEDGEELLVRVWYRKWEILFKGIMVIGMSIAIMRIVSTVGIGIELLFEEPEPESPAGFYRWETSGYEGFYKRLTETIWSVGENGKSVVWIGNTYTPEEAMYVTQEEVSLFNHKVDMKHNDYNAGILAKISPTFQYRVEAYLLRKKFIIIVPQGTIITDFFKKEEIQKII